MPTYKAKRDFGKTPEPGAKRASAKGNSFVIQKHAARRTHFDFRLEHDGVLKSWAVTKGPSLDPGEKRLAVRTEDHPLEYGGFEGVIPKGEYGGGPVMIWDEGTWEPINDPDEGLAKGDLKFRLHGASPERRLRAGAHEEGPHRRQARELAPDQEARRSRRRRRRADADRDDTASRAAAPWTRSRPARTPRSGPPTRLKKKLKREASARCRQNRYESPRGKARLRRARACHARQRSSARTELAARSQI